MKQLSIIFLLLIPFLSFSQSAETLTGSWTTTQTIIETGDTVAGAECILLNEDGTCTFTYFDPSYKEMNERSIALEMSGNWEYDESTKSVVLFLDSPYSANISKQEYRVIDCNDTCLILNLPDLNYTYIYHKKN